MISRLEKLQAGFSFTRGLPSGALAADVHPSSPWTAARRVLLYGEMLLSLRRALARGAGLVAVRTLGAAIEALSSDVFDAIAVEADAPGAFELIGVIKLGHRIPSVAEAAQREAVERHRRTPIVVLPMGAEASYAVLVQSPGVAYLEDPRILPLDEALVRLDVQKLFFGDEPREELA